MDIKERLHIARQEYIEKYKRNPNVIFVSHSLFTELDNMMGGQSLYGASPKHLWGADVIVVLTPNYIKFAEDSDIKKAINQFNVNNSLNSYRVKKSRMIAGSIRPEQHIPPKFIDLEPIEFSKEEIEIYLMQS
jgi:hypothetical protein